MSYVGGLTSRKAFTLVEILIVVVILAILAAIVIPRYSHATDEASVSNAYSQLQAIRSQILMYQAQHNAYPTLAQMEDFAALLNRTDAAGNIDADGEYGPYFRKAPMNPFTNSATVVALGAGGAEDGWEYDPDTGKIFAVGFNEQTGEFVAPGDAEDIEE